MAIQMTLTRRAAFTGLALAAGGCATAGAERGGSVQVGGLSIEYSRRGHGQPTVVFESGLGDGMGIWDATRAALRTNIATFAYSRPGYGASTPANDAERTSDEAASLLKDALRAAGVYPPYILVGHSLGGLYIAKYAAQFRSDVAGLVFVDARPPRFRALCQTRSVARCDGSQTPSGDRPAHILAEAAGVRASEEMAPFPRILSRLPATMIVSTQVWPGEDGAAAFALWNEAQIEFYQRFEEARFVRAEGAGHYVQRDRPDLVAAEIERLRAGI